MKTKDPASGTEAEPIAALLTEARRRLAAGDLAGAERALARLEARAPGHSQGLYWLGLLRHRQGRQDEARDLLERALPGLGRDPVAQFNIGTVLLEQGRLGEAAARFQAALDLRPGYDDAAVQLAVAWRQQGEAAAALGLFRDVVKRSPGHLAARLNLAAALLDEAPQEARREAARVAAVAPAGAVAARAMNLEAKALAAFGEETAARRRYREVLAAYPDDLRAAFGQAITLPQVYRDMAEVAASRTRYGARLAAFAQSLRLDTPARAAAAAEAVFALHNFPLPQQGRDDRELQALYGELLSRVAAAAHPGYGAPPARPPRRARPRIAFVSAFFHHHSIAKTHGRWMSGLDPARFEVIGVHTGPVLDVMSERLAAGCARFLHHPRHDRSLLRLLYELAADAIVYPDLGMEPSMLLPAALRLAPLQCQGLGHPVTSGLPTIDWALSSDLMEPEDGARHYTEQLLRLPNLSFCYERDRILADRGKSNPRSRRRSALVYLCSQNLGKILPDQDPLFARILAAVPDSELWFLARPESAVTERFRTRILAQCRLQGVAAERVVIQPRLGQSDFLALNEAADVALDALAWSGSNTSLEAIAMGLPVVTRPGRLMRSRHSAAMLDRMGIDETLARSAEAYVAIAVRLGRDPAWRDSVTRRFHARRHLLYDDEAPLRALEDFLLRATARG